MEKNKLIALFPGRNYNVDMPLLYYARFKYDIRGYDDLQICYGDYYSEEKSIEECMTIAKENVLKQVSNVDFSRYDDIIFVSKSIGTVIAGWLAEELGIKVRHIFLTPLEGTLPYIKEHNVITVIAGTEDKMLDSNILSEYCKKEGVYLKQFKGVGHRLEVFNDFDINLDILKQIVELY